MTKGFHKIRPTSTCMLLALVKSSYKIQSIHGNISRNTTSKFYRVKMPTGFTRLNLCQHQGCWHWSLKKCTL